MFVRRTGKVRLLTFADNIFQLNQHQAGARAREIAQDRVAELGCVGRRSAIGEKFTEPLGCKQPLLDERLQQQVAVLAPLRRIDLGGGGIGIEIEAAPPSDVGAEPETPESG